jgi:hypothetical protein
VTAESVRNPLRRFTGRRIVTETKGRRIRVG